MVPTHLLSLGECGFRPNRRGNIVGVSRIRPRISVLHDYSSYCSILCDSISVSKALQEFDLALRGKKKREKFLNDGKRKKELTVTLTFS